MLAVAAAALLWGCGSSSPTTPTGPTPTITIVETIQGTGALAGSGDVVSVNYQGMLTNGTIFDTTYGANGSPNQPYAFTLSAGQVIPGFDQGVLGMRVGGLRHVTIPPELAYGSTTQGPIPPNSTLIFDIALVAVNHS
jgi:FKBP-type peptidyl-prolyl cis-trans isomerase